MIRPTSFLSLLILSGCSIPQTVPEFRAYARESSYMDRREYSVKNLSLQKAEKILWSFTKKCLGQKIIEGVPTGSEYGGTYKFVYHHRPRIIRQKGMVSLVMQVDSDNASVGAPKNGYFQLLVEITPSISSGVDVFSANFSGQLGNVLEDIESWLREKNQFCPAPI